MPLAAPDLDAGWLARPFAEQVSDVVAWLDGAVLAIGHSWGGWLLLAAAAEQVAVGRPIPHILLLGTVLGAGTHPGANLGYLAPRSGRVLAALGLRERPGAVLIPRDRLTFIHGVDDDQSPSAALGGLPAAGHRVVLVPGGHGVAGDDARTVIGEELGRFARQTT